MESVTTISHCLVEGNIAYTGTKESIVNQLLDFKFENGTLYFKSKTKSYTNYSDYHDNFIEIMGDLVPDVNVFIAVNNTMVDYLTNDLKLGVIDGLL